VTAKLLYRAERHPDLDRRGFRLRWRQHAALGMSQPRWTNIRRYAHCDPIDDHAPCDGVALLWYRDEAARLRHIADPTARATMRADEAETFARPVRGFSTLMSEWPAGPRNAAHYKHFAFLWRDTATSRPAYVRNCLDRHAARRRAQLARLPGFRDFTLNIARDETALDGFGLDCDLIEESDWIEPITVPDGPPDDTVRVEELWTRHVLLYDAADHA
jgi:hypothetical protein